MNTNKSCFDSEKELMIWQDTNCLQCKKAVWYNQRLKKMPQYRCAIQKQIEAQAAGETEINERTYEATRCKKCTFFKSKGETSDVPVEVLDFSKGESLMKPDILMTTEDANGKQVLQPAYYDQDALIPLSVVPEDDSLLGQKSLYPQNSGEEVREMQKRYKFTTDFMAAVDQYPKDISTHPDPILFKLAMETGVDYDALKDAERRMFDTLSEKGQLPPVFTETNFKKQVKSDVHTMLETFTWKENMMIAFVPLIISHIAWAYADKVLKCCAELRISETIKLSRAVKKIHQEYIESLKKDLDPLHIERIEKQSERFYKEYQNDFVILWYCINFEYKRRYPNDRLTAMRTDAYFSILMCRYFVEHNKRMDKLIESKMGFAQSIKNPYMDKLETCMDAYCGENTIKNTPNIDACMRVFQKNLDDIEFEVDDSEPK